MAGLKEGEEYFFVLMTPTDPNSFVTMSDNNRVVVRPVGAQAAPPRPMIAFGAKYRPEPRIKPEQFCKLCPVGLLLICCVLTYGFAALGSPLGMLDLLAIDSNRLYRASNSKNVKAFIGFMKGEPDLLEESRKRRRVD